MSAIPPPWLASILQAHGAQQRAAEAREREQAQRQRGPDFADNLHEVIENNDRDSRAYADAEGTGSQGRPSEPEQSPSTDEPPPDDRSRGRHLDIEA